MKIHRIQTGEVQIKARHVTPRFSPYPARVLDVLADRSWSPRMPIACWAIEHPDGLVLVDTGESSHADDPGYQPWWHPFMRFCERRWVRPEEEVGAQLRALGLDPAAVRWVVMTHMHGDHAGGLGWFAAAEILMSADEAKMALARTGPLVGYLTMHYPEWLDPTRVTFEDGTWESFAANTSLTQDGAVRLVPTPGHTKGHLSVAVETGDSLVLIAGDAAYSEHALLAGVVDGVAQSTAAHRDSTHRLRELCRRRRVITQFAHDPRSAERLAGDVPTAVSDEP